jgi:hypothetical protein
MKIFAAGMYGSGSTAYFNLITFILDELGYTAYSHDGTKLESGESHNKRYMIVPSSVRRACEPSSKRSTRPDYIIYKIHEKESCRPPFREDKRNIHFLSYRSLRQCAASFYIAYGLKKGNDVTEKTIEHVDRNINIFNEWSELKNITIFNFEDIVFNTNKIIDIILDKLNIELAGEQKNLVCSKMKELPNKKDINYQRHLMTRDNVHPELHGGSYMYDWETILPQEIKNYLEKVKNEIYY